jgi:hypothetical protein
LLVPEKPAISFQPKPPKDKPWECSPKPRGIALLLQLERVKGCPFLEKGINVLGKNWVLLQPNCQILDFF